ncbi:MAG TPA: hypothetical protein VHQ86_04955 [Candidatus Saccharimonadia bacterium]|jgi:hypothetical protein|nr:hypothetical protein [Candidatus Saccharimonadia bacterium]
MARVEKQSDDQDINEAPDQPEEKDKAETEAEPEAGKMDNVSEYTDESEKDDENEGSEKNERVEEPAEPKGGNVFVRTWRWIHATRKRTILTVAGIVVVLAAAVIGLTDLRYAVLGAVLKSSVTLRVVDQTSSLPVPHASVALAGQTQFSDKTGAATFTHVKPGKTTVVVSRAGYATLSQKQTIGFGDVSLGTVKLKATGVQVVTQVSNVLAGGSVEGVEVKAGDVQAITDKTGKATLAFPPSAVGTTVSLEYSRDGFNTLKKSVQVTAGAAPIAAAMVAEGKVFYLSNRSGKLDLYESNLDGSGAEVALAGTGNETPETGILPNSENSSYIALVSARDGKRDSYGNIISALYIFNTLNHQATKIESDYSFGYYRAWVGNTLVYEKPGVTCPDIKGYDAVAQKSTVLVPSAGNGCPKILAPYDDGFFYSISNTNSDKDGVYYGQIGKASKHVASTPAQNIVRKTKDALLTEYFVYTPQYTTEWQNIDLEALTATKVAQGPADTSSRTYNDSPNDKKSSFIEERDGKTELYLTDSDGSNEKKLTSVGNVNQYVSWMGDDYIVFSVSKSDENALYVVAVSTGKVSKVTDFYRANLRTYGGGSNPAY